MKHTLFALAVVSALAATPAAQAAKSNFTGTWTLDIAKSDFGGAPPPESMVMVVEHKDPTIRIKSTQKSSEGEVVNDRTLTIDGKPSTNKITMMGGEQQSITSTSKWDGAKFVTTYPITVEGNTINFVDTWSVEGTVLNIARQIQTPEGVITITTVFNKK
jgi:hypothetical protein